MSDNDRTTAVARPHRPDTLGYASQGEHVLRGERPVAGEAVVRFGEAKARLGEAESSGALRYGTRAFGEPGESGRLPGPRGEVSRWGEVDPTGESVPVGETAFVVDRTEGVSRSGQSPTAGGARTSQFIVEGGER